MESPLPEEGPLSRRQIQDALKDVDASDGFRVVPVDAGYEQSLHLELRANGERTPAAMVPEPRFWLRKGLQADDYGGKARLTHLAEALCRYVNTGGTLDEAGDLLAAFDAILATCRLAVAPGFALIRSEQDSEGTFTHLFARRGCNYAIRWVEDQFLDVVPLADVLKELEEEQREVLDEYAKRATEGPVPGPRNRLELQPGQGPGPAPGPAGPPDPAV